MFVQVAMDQPVMVSEVQIDTPPVQAFGRGGRGGPAATPPAPGFPREYELQVSMDGNRWTTVSSGAGAPGTMVIALKQPVRARFVRVNQTASAPDAPAWSMQRLRIYQVPAR
jgi:hypothetical protein